MEETLNNMKFDVGTIARMMKLNIDELADACDIPRGHLRQVSAGNTKMTARDLMQISNFTQIPPKNIQY